MLKGLNLTICLSLCLGLLNPLPAQALTPVNLEQALKRVYQDHPELARLRLEQDILAAKARFAGTGPNPELALLAEDFVGSAAFNDDRFTQFTLELAQALPLGDRLERSRQLAALNQQLAYWDYRMMLQELGVDVYSAYAELWQLEAELNLAQELIRSAEAIHELLSKAVSAGKLAATALLQSELELESARAERARVQLEQQRASQKLALLWSGTESDLKALTPPPELIDADTLRARLSLHPRLARWQSEREQRDAALTAAQSQTMPDLMITGGLRYHPPFDWGGVLMLGLPLPFNSANQAGIEEARLRRAAWEQEREREARLLLARYTQALQQLEAHTSLIQILKRQGELAAELEAAAQKSFSAGKTGALEVLNAHRASVQQKRQLLAAQRAQLMARIAVLSTVAIDFAEAQLGASP